MIKDNHVVFVGVIKEEEHFRSDLVDILLFRQPEDVPFRDIPTPVNIVLHIVNA